MAKLSLSNIGPMDNFIINGDMGIWQRGTSFATIASAAFSADRWEYQKSAAVVHTASQSSDVPTTAESNHESTYSLLLDVTTADAAVGSTDYASLLYSLEGVDTTPLVGHSITLSFWVKATKTGTYCISFNNKGDTKSYIVEYTVNTTATWEKKTMTLTLPSTDTWTADTTASLRIYFTLMAGTAYHNSADTWVSGLDLATSNQVNACDSTANDFRLAQVQLELGTRASVFKSRLTAQELALCQRYYQRLGLVANSPFGAGSLISTTTFIGHMPFIVSMRTSPTVTDTGNFHVRAAAGTLTASSVSFGGSRPEAVQIEATVTGATAGQGGTLRSSDANAYIEAAAEL